MTPRRLKAQRSTSRSTRSRPMRSERRECWRSAWPKLRSCRGRHAGSAKGHVAGPAQHVVAGALNSFRVVNGGTACSSPVPVQWPRASRSSQCRKHAESRRAAKLSPNTAQRSMSLACASDDRDEGICRMTVTWLRSASLGQSSRDQKIRSNGSAMVCESPGRQPQLRPGTHHQAPGTPFPPGPTTSTCPNWTADTATTAPSVTSQRRRTG